MFSQKYNLVRSVGCFIGEGVLGAQKGKGKKLGAAESTEFED